MSLEALGRGAGAAVQLAEGGRGEQVPVADDLVDDVRLGRVERQRRVAHVLGGVKRAIGERGVERAQVDEAGGRHVAPAAEAARVAR